MRDLIRRGRAAQRGRGHELRHPVRRQARGHAGVHQAGTDRVDADAVRGEFHGGGAGHREYRALGGVVRERAAGADHRQYRGDVDDRAAGPGEVHLRYRFPHAQPGTPLAHLDGAGPLRVGQVAEAAQSHRAGVVDQYPGRRAEPAGQPHRARPVTGVGDVEGAAGGPARYAGRVDLLGDRVARLRVEIGDQYRHAVGSEGGGDGAADVPGRPGDDGDGHDALDHASATACPAAWDREIPGTASPRQRRQSSSRPDRTTAGRPDGSRRTVTSRQEGSA